MASEKDDQTRREEMETIRDVLTRLQTMADSNLNSLSAFRPDSAQSARPDDSIPFDGSGVSEGSGAANGNGRRRHSHSILASFDGFRNSIESDSVAPDHSRSMYDGSGSAGAGVRIGPNDELATVRGDAPVFGDDVSPVGRVGSRSGTETDARGRGLGKKLAIAALVVVAALGGGLFVLAKLEPSSVSLVATERVSGAAQVASLVDQERTAEPVAMQSSTAPVVTAEPPVVPVAPPEPATNPVIKPPSIGFDDVVEVSGAGAVALPLRVDAALLQGVSDYYLTVSGLPAGATLNKGRIVFPGTWALEHNEFQDLQLTMPSNAPPTIRVGIMLVERPGRILAEGNGIITTRSDGAIEPSKESVGNAGGAESVDGPVSRGLALLAIEKIDEARALFKEAAEGGDSDGAYFLALTYDPQYLKNTGGSDATSDVDMAKQWYTVAASRGSSDAADRLRTLDVH